MIEFFAFENDIPTALVVKIEDVLHIVQSSKYTSGVNFYQDDRDILALVLSTLNTLKRMSNFLEAN